MGRKWTKLTATSVDIEGVKFSFVKKPAMAGKDVWEALRVGIAEVVGEVPEGSAGEMAFMQIAMGLPRETFEETRVALFEDVTWQSKDSPTPAVLLGDEDMAFQGLEVVHIYEVWARACAVNFHGSWDAIRSMLPPQAAAALEQWMADLRPSM